MHTTNLRDLKYIIEVAKTRHFGKAAERCFVGQPTLSAQLRKLEEELGVVIFECTNFAMADASRRISLVFRQSSPGRAALEAPANVNLRKFPDTVKRITLSKKTGEKICRKD